MSVVSFETFQRHRWGMAWGMVSRRHAPRQYCGTMRLLAKSLAFEWGMEGFDESPHHIDTVDESGARGAWIFKSSHDAGARE